MFSHDFRSLSVLSTAPERYSDVAMVAERIQRGGRRGRDRIWPDQSLEV